MISFRRPAASFVLALSLGAVVLAQQPAAPALDIRMGLWEVANTVDFGGGMRAKPTMTKSCMTREAFDRQSFMIVQKNCTQTLTKNTKTLLEATVACTGEQVMNGTTHVEAPTPTAFTGNVKSVSTQRGQTINLNMTMTGKWLGADCGTVK